MISELKQLGLTKYEILAYETLLNLGRSPAPKISQNSGVPYGKIYSVMDLLLKRGLVDVISGNKKEFVPNNPDLLLSLLKEKEDSLTHLKNKLKGLSDIYGRKEIKFDENKIIVRQGLNAFYKIIKNLKKPTKYNYSIKWTSEFHKDWAQKQKEQLEKGIDVKVLTRYNSDTKKDVQKYLKYNKNIKKMENEGFALSLQDDEEVMMTLIENNTTILIKSKAFAKTIKKLFLAYYEKTEKIE